MKDFMGESGYGVIAFDLTRTGKQGLSDIPKIGDMQLHLDFHHPLPQNTSYILIMVCTFDYIYFCCVAYMFILIISGVL